MRHELSYQPIGYRWARNLAQYAAPEPWTFVRYFDSLADFSATVVSRASHRVRPDAAP